MESWHCLGEAAFSGAHNPLRLARSKDDSNTAGQSYFSEESLNNSILIEGWSPIPRESWITFLAPFQDDEFVIFANSLSQGRVHVYSTSQDKTLKLNTIQEHIWGGDLSRRGALLLAHDQGVLSICQLGVKDTELKLAAHERFHTGQRRVDQAAWILGHSEQTFATRTRDSLLLWDATRRGEIPLQTLVSGEIVRELAVPQTDSQIIACSLEREIRLYDIRSGQVALSLPSGAHHIRWNPFIPYWLAAASDIGDNLGIGIHDLRYKREDPLVGLPARSTSDLCWSNANCELLLSSSSSRRMFLWSISRRENPELQSFEGLPCGRYGEEITGLQPSLRRPNMFFGIGLLGSLIMVQINQSCVKSLAPMYLRRRADHPKQDHRLESIERSLYCRDFDAVFKDLLEFASSTSPSQFESLQRLSNQTLPMLPISPESWSIGYLAEECPATFWSDITKYSQGIPPSFYLRISEQPDAIEEVRFKVKILEAIRHSDGALLAKLTDRIMNMLAADSSFLGHPTLVSITGVLLSNYRLDGLRFGRQVLDLITASCGSSNRGNRTTPSAISGDACALCHLLLFPTIFDVEAVSIIQSSRNASPIRSPPGDRLEKKSLATIAGGESDVKNVIQPNTDQNKTSSPHSHSQSRHQRQTPPKQTSGKELLALRKFIRQTEKACAMVDLEIALEEANGDQARSNELLLKSLQNDLEGKTAAARTAFKYLEYIRGESQLESYLITLIPYCQKPRTDFSYTLLEHVDRHVMPSLKYTLSQAIDTHRPSLVLRALLLIVLLVDGRRPLPDDLELFLTDRLRRLLRALQGEDYSRMPDYGRLVKTVTSITGEDSADNSEMWKQIGLLKDHLRSAM